MTRKVRENLGNIIFETDTPAAKLFDVVVLWAILLSVALVMLESVLSLRGRYGATLRALEWCFTVLFTVEYLLRIYAARKRLRYVTSFYGVVDLLAVLPSYLSLVVVGSQYLIVIRSLRLLRIFRVLKLARYLGEANTLVRALRASRVKIIVFLWTVLTLVVIIGSVMYLVEGAESGFTNIPISVYWGHRHPHNCRLRRHRAADAAGTDALGAGDDSGLRHHRGADGHRPRPSWAAPHKKSGRSGCGSCAPTADEAVTTRTRFTANTAAKPCRLRLARAKFKWLRLRSPEKFGSELSRDTE